MFLVPTCKVQWWIRLGCPACHSWYPLSGNWVVIVVPLACCHTTKLPRRDGYLVYLFGWRGHVYSKFWPIPALETGKKMSDFSCFVWFAYRRYHYRYAEYLRTDITVTGTGMSLNLSLCGSNGVMRTSSCLARSVSGFMILSVNLIGRSSQCTVPVR